jgi:hypothetical protein
MRGRCEASTVVAWWWENWPWGMGLCQFALMIPSFTTSAKAAFF